MEISMMFALNAEFIQFIITLLSNGFTQVCEQHFSKPE